MCLCSAVTAFILYVRPLLQVRSYRFLLCWLLTGLRCKLLRLLCWNSTPAQAVLAGLPLSHAAASWQVSLVPVAGNSGRRVSGVCVSKRACSQEMLVRGAESRAGDAGMRARGAGNGEGVPQLRQGL